MAPEMPPLIITATPNKSWLNPELAYPEAIADVAAEAERCVAGGASILHLHSVSEWVPLIAAVRAVAGDALVQCGMSSMLLEDRMDIYEQGADMISIIASHHAEAFPAGAVAVLTPRAIEEYRARRQLMPPGCVVTVSVMGPERYGILAAAITSGDHVRVGTEDYGYDRRGKPAQASDLASELAGLAEALWWPVATPGEARKMLAFGPAR